jgi:hypothetical protein
MLPPPRVLSKDVLVAAGFKSSALLPLGDNVLLQANQSAIPAHKRFSSDCSRAAFAQSIAVLDAGTPQMTTSLQNCNNLQVLTDNATGLAAAASDLDFMGSQFIFRCNDVRRMMHHAHTLSSAAIPQSVPLPLSSPSLLNARLPCPLPPTNNPCSIFPIVNMAPLFSLSLPPLLLLPTLLFRPSHPHRHHFNARHQLIGGSMGMCHMSRHTSHVAHRTSHLTPRTLQIAPHTSHLARYTSHITPHTSHLTRYTSHLTPRTLHITPHTKHKTHHTSHVTPLSMVTPVRNQGSCGCCWAKSAVASMETNAAVAAAKTLSSPRGPVQLSSQFLVDCAEQQEQHGLIPIKGLATTTIIIIVVVINVVSGCFGGWPADGMNFSKTIGTLHLYHQPIAHIKHSLLLCLQCAHIVSAVIRPLHFKYNRTERL